MSLRNKRVTVLLVVSLALNLFFAGFLVARSMSGGRHAGPKHGPHGVFLGPHGLLGDEAGVGAAQAKQVKQVLARHAERFHKGRQGLRESRQAVRKALNTEPFEPAELRAAFAQLRAQTGQSQAAMHDALVELATGLSPEQRKQLWKRSRRLLR